VTRNIDRLTFGQRCHGLDPGAAVNYDGDAAKSKTTRAGVADFPRLPLDPGWRRVFCQCGVSQTSGLSAWAGCGDWLAGFGTCAL
jgi:hypothetical protein